MNERSGPVFPYTHDCPDCLFVGHIQDTGNSQLDIYICTRSGGDASVIIRFGNDAPDYWSLPVFRLRELLKERV